MQEFKEAALNMDKIEKYIERFFKHTKPNERYDMSTKEWKAIANSGKGICDIISTTFSFGYAKGYRAALAEQKKGGTV